MNKMLKLLKRTNKLSVVSSIFMLVTAIGSIGVAICGILNAAESLKENSITHITGVYVILCVISMLILGIYKITEKITNNVIEEFLKNKINVLLKKSGQEVYVKNIKRNGGYTLRYYNIYLSDHIGFKEEIKITEKLKEPKKLIEKYIDKDINFFFYVS